MPFEVFHRSQTALSGEPTVTIQKQGAISLNGAAFRALDEPAAVELLYDPNNHLVAFRKIDPAAEHSYSVRPLKNSKSTFIISGRAFTKHYQIDTQAARRWLAKLEPGGLLVVDIKKPSLEIAGNRKATLQERSLAYG